MKRKTLIFLLFCVICGLCIAGSSTTFLSLYKPSSGETGWATQVNSNFDKIDTAVGTEHNTNGTHKTDVIDDTNIDWGTGAAQVSADDIPDGSTNAIITLTQETNFTTAYTHSQNDGDTSATNEIQDLSLSGDTLSLSDDATSVDLSGYYNSLTDLQGSVSNDFHNLGGTDLVNDADADATNEINTIQGDDDVATTGLNISIDGAGIATTDVVDNTLTITATEAQTLQAVADLGDTVTDGVNLATEGGNVGIGTTSPSAKLDLVGNAEITGTTTISGNVGIGTTSTASALSVTGDIVVSGDVDGVDVSTLPPAVTGDITWSDGTNATNTWTFDVSGTDHTMAFGSGVVTFGDSVVVTDVLTTTKNIQSVPHHILATVVSPALVYAVDTQVILWNKTPAALTVTNLEFTCDADPTTEPTGDLKYADSCIGFANATVINDFDTTDGVRTDSSITSGAVAAGKCIYMQYDTTPDSNTKQHNMDVTFDYD